MPISQEAKHVGPYLDQLDRHLRLAVKDDVNNYDQKIWYEAVDSAGMSTYEAMKKGRYPYEFFPNDETGSTPQIVAKNYQFYFSEAEGAFVQRIDEVITEAWIQEFLSDHRVFGRKLMQECRARIREINVEITRELLVRVLRDFFLSTQKNTIKTTYVEKKNKLVQYLEKYLGIPGSLAHLLAQYPQMWNRTR